MAQQRKKAFEGIRVADFSWVGAGPLTAKYLADHGAEVIRVESLMSLDTLRRSHPFVDNEPGVDRSGYFANFNSSKKGITLNLKHARGVELAKRLVAECDVVIESFRGGTMARMGLGYDDLRAVRPDIVMLSMPLFGQTGPWAEYSGYGHGLQGTAGINHLTGWPDGAPLGTGIAYTDFAVPHLGALALIAALDYRRRTGTGQYIDFSQYEAAVHMLGTAILDWTANGHEQTRMGNRDPEAAPHGCYKCKDGKWIVVACFTEKQWDGFRAALGRPDWVDLERMRRKWQRLNEQKEIDRHMVVWCEEFTSNQVLRMMQDRGVPCGIVKSPEDIARDPQLKHRKHLWSLDHPVMGTRTYDGPAFRLSKTPAQLSPAPLLGQDNEYVYRDLLGIPEEEFIELLADGAFE